MDFGAILWPLIWIWIGAAIGFLGVGVLSAARKDHGEPGHDTDAPVLVPVHVAEISLRHTGPNAWEARLLDGAGSIILKVSGPTPDVAMRMAVEECSRLELANGVA